MSKQRKLGDAEMEREGKERRPAGKTRGDIIRTLNLILRKGFRKDNKIENIKNIYLQLLRAKQYQKGDHVFQ